MDGKTLRDMRTRARVRQKDLASAIAVTHPLISMYERGVRRIPERRESEITSAIARLGAARRYAALILTSAILESRQAGRVGA